MFFMSHLPPEVITWLENFGTWSADIFPSEWIGGMYNDHLAEYVSMVPLTEIGMTALLLFMGIGLMNDMASGRM